MNSPLDPTAVCCDVVVTCDNVGFSVSTESEIATIALATDIAANQPLAVPKQIRTFGHSVLGRGPGLYENVASPNLAMPAIFRKTDFNGNLFEAVIRNTLDAELAGIVADGVTDNAAAITAASDWLGAKGGGRLLFPVGTIVIKSAPRLGVNGVIWEGASLGDETTRLKGTVLFSQRTDIGPKIIIGLEADYNVSKVATSGIRRMQLVGTGGMGYLVEVQAARGVYLQDLVVINTSGGFLQLGTSLSKMYVMSLNNVYGDVYGALSEDYAHGLLMQNFIGGLVMSDCHIGTGGGSIMPVIGGCGIKIPEEAGERPDGVNIANCGLGGFYRGIDIRGGGANWFTVNTYLDNIHTAGLYLEPSSSLNNFRFSNGHIIGRYLDPPSGSAGIVLGQIGPGLLRDILFSGNSIKHWSTNGLLLAGGAEILITGNLLHNCTQFADNASDTIQVVGTPANFVIAHNVLTNGPNRHRYGINNLREAVGFAPYSIVHNVIDNPGSNGINDPNRASGQLKKVVHNSSQGGVGSASSYGPWFASNLVSSSVSEQMFRVDGFGQGVVAPRRGRIIGLSGQINPPLTAGWAEIYVNINGTPVITVRIEPPDMINQYAPDDGIPFNTGDVLSIRYSTSASIVPLGSADLMADLLVYWD